MNTITHMHGTLKFANSSEIEFVTTALMKKGLIRDLGKGLVFIDSNGSQISDSYDLPVIDGLEVIIPFGGYEFLSSEIIALANKFKPTGDLIAFTTTGNIHVTCYKKHIHKDSGFICFKSVIGATDIFALVKPSLDSEDIDLFESALKTDEASWNQSFGWAGDYDQVRFDIIEMASTRLSAKV